MKAIEILAENKNLEEGPVTSFLGQAAKRIGAAALSKAGLNTWAGQLSGKADVGQYANRYAKEFQGYLNLIKKKMDAATFGDLEDFMVRNKIPTNNIPKDNLAGVMDKASLNAILTRTAQDHLKGEGGASTSSRKPADQPADQQEPNQQAGNQTQPQQQQQQNTPQQNSNIPFSVPALVQVIPQMNKRDLNKILTATQQALSNKQTAAKNAKNTTVSGDPTAGMTADQKRKFKQAQAQNAIDAQTKAQQQQQQPAPAVQRQPYRKKPKTTVSTTPGGTAPATQPKVKVAV